MPDLIRIVSPGLDGRSVRAADGEILHPPADWVLVPPGDPALTRRIKVAGPAWVVQEKKGRKIFSRGVWTLGSTVETIRLALLAERALPQHAAKQAAQARRRNQTQADYVQTFRRTVLDYLAFHSRYAALAERMADLVSAHATPVGSGTVVRTQRIPVEQRAEAAVIAWMRHQSSAYDQMIIPHIKGKRQEVRRLIAQKSKAILEAYRAGREMNPATCPLQRAIGLNAGRDETTIQ